MNEQDLKYVIEATLLAAGKPVTTQQLLELFEERERPTPELLQAALNLLVEDYATRGIELIEVASGWRIQVRPRMAEVVSRLWSERPSRYSRALLETLALVAYRQPITRSEIEEIRGVSISSTIMRTLHERNWIRTVGHREVPGRPELLGTTREFLDYFGLKSLDQLPTLAELKDVETIGVQLELPAAEAAAVSAEASGEAGEGAEAAADATVAADDSAEGVQSVEGHEGEVVADVGDTTVEANAEAEDDADADADAEIEADADNEDAEESVESSEASADDSELSADADDGDEDSDESSTLVASSDDEDTDRGAIGEPPVES